MTAVEDLYEVYNAGDFDRLSALVTEDARLEDVALGMTFEGPAGFRQWLGTFATGFPGSRADLTKVVREGDWVATEHIGRGTHAGPLVTPAGEIPATGRSVELRFAEIFELRDDKIALLRVYWDTATLMRQLGVAAP